MIGQKPPVVVSFPRSVQPSRPTPAPELTAFINLSRFLHEHELVAFYCMARHVMSTAKDRGGPARDVRVLQQFITDWDND